MKNKQKISEIREIFIFNVKNGRRIKQFTQARLAEECNLSIGFIAEIETGKKFPSPENIQNIAEALGLRPFQLFLSPEESDTFNSAKVILNLKSNVLNVVSQVFEDYQSETT